MAIGFGFGIGKNRTKAGGSGSTSASAVYNDSNNSAATGPDYAITVSTTPALGKTRLVMVGTISSADCVFSDVTIDGIAATQVGTTSKSDVDVNGNVGALAFFRAPGTASTTTSVEFTVTATASYSGYAACWTLSNIGSLIDTINVGGTDPDLSLNTVAGGVAIGACIAYGTFGIGDMDWTGLTEDFQGLSVFTEQLTGAHASTTTQNPRPISLEINPDPANDPGTNSIAVSFGPGGGGGPVNLLDGPWIPGVDTTVSYVGDIAYAVADNDSVNPRMYKAVNLIFGHNYEIQAPATIYPNDPPFGNNIIFRLADNPGLASGGLGIFDEATGSNTDLSRTFVSPHDGTFYFGIVQIGGTTGDKGGIDNLIKLIDLDAPVVPSGPRSYYIDSVAGSDSNDGLTEATPFATIGKINSAGGYMDNVKIYLKRGSHWREELNAGDGVPQGGRVVAYGDPSDPMPVLDGSDIIPNADFTVDGTYPNVYNVTVNYRNGEDIYMSMWEDDVRPKYVTSKALCDATPGTWTMGTTDGFAAGTSGELSIHPLGSTDPTTDGKVYEYAPRYYALYVGSRWVVQNIRCQKAMHNNGMAIFGQRTQVTGCIFQDGVKHNAFVNEGCTVNDCIIWKNDWGNRIEWIGIVAFQLTATNGIVTFNRCICHLERSHEDFAIASGKGFSAFGAHTDGSSTEGNWSRIEYNDCSVKNSDGAFGCNDTNLLVLNRCYAEDATIPVFTGAQAAQITDCWFNSPTIDMIRGIASPVSNANTTIDGLRMYVTNGIEGQIFDTASGGTINIGQSTLVRGPGDGSYAYILRIDGSKVVSSTGNIMHFDQSNGEVGMSMQTPGSVGGNLYTGSDQMDWQIGDNEYFNYEDYRAAETMIDANSIFQVDNVVTDPANGDFTTIEANMPPGVIGLGVQRFPTYTPIPDHLTIAAM